MASTRRAGALALGACAVACLVPVAVADVYMHNPRGSNNRLNEQSANRNNANRLFDSQNNNKGGYNVGDQGADASSSEDEHGVLTYYSGSKLCMEWTNQHGCGAGTQGKTECQMVIQYTCAGPESKTCVDGTEEIRDGTSTNTIDPDNPQSDRGIHESVAWYNEFCKVEARNKGLWTADQELKKETPQATRQNPNGNRYGLECPEERDYYPYWYPTPWKDLAVLTSEPERCDYYREHSENVAGRLCGSDEGRDGGQMLPSWDLPAPKCLPAPTSRDNHLGNTPEGDHMKYCFEVPEPVDMCGAERSAQEGGCECVLRLRYNISTYEVARGLNASHNGYLGANSPVENNVRLDMGVGQALALAMNTAQYGRTFQDRSHKFRVEERPVNISSDATIHNVNVRGKRGNIVQTYPAVEYDFVPTTLSACVGDYVHFQWTGSNTHNNGNPAGDGQAGDDGEGTGGTDRSNIVQIEHLTDNYPLNASRITLFDDLDAAIAFATAGAGQGVDPLLNDAPATFNFYPLRLNRTGTFHYACTRNNNFSNRGQKGTIVVKQC